MIMVLSINYVNGESVKKRPAKVSFYKHIFYFERFDSSQNSFIHKFWLSSISQSDLIYSQNLFIHINFAGKIDG